MALLSLPLITRRRRIAAARPQIVAPEVTADPAPEPAPVVTQTRTNPYAGLEAALTTGGARLNLMRNLRG